MHRVFSGGSAALLERIEAADPGGYAFIATYPAGVGHDEEAVGGPPQHGVVVALGLGPRGSERVGLEARRLPRVRNVEERELRAEALANYRESLGIAQVIAQIDALSPTATLPIRGVLLRASKVYHWPDR